MTDADRLDSEKLERVRNGMTAAEIETLRARFERDPNSLSREEIGVLYLVTREKIRGFEAKAQRKRDKGGNPPDE